LNQRSRSLLLYLYSIGVGLAGIGALAVLADRVSWTQIGLPLAFFAFLSLIIKRTGFHVAPGVTHSLVGVVDVAALLIFGPVAGGTVALISGLAYLLLRAFRHQTRPWGETLETALFNAGLKALMALASGWLYTLAGGGDFLAAGLSDVFPLLVLFAAWFTLDHLGWGLREGIQGGLRQTWAFLRSVWITSLLVELCPLPAAVIIVFVYNQGNWFVFLLLSAGIVAVALVVQRLADAWQQVKRRLSELDALSRAGQAIVRAQLDVDQLCELIYQQASQIVDTSSFHLGLFDGNDYTLKIWVRDNVRQPSQTFSLAADEGIVGWMRRSKQPLLVRDFRREMESLPARPSYVSEHPPRSAVFVPLIAGDEVIGTMAIQSYTPAAFSEDDLRLLSVMGNEAAMAIEKARLYAAQQEEAWATTVLLQVAEATSRLSNLDDVLTTVVRLIPMLVGVDRCGLLLWDKNVQVFLPAQAYGLTHEQEITFSTLRFAPGDALALDEVRLTKSPRVLSGDELASSMPPTMIEAFDIRNLLILPLLARGQVVGVMLVDYIEGSARFTERKVTMISGIANQAAIAIENAQFYAAQQEEAYVSTALLQVAEAVGSITDLDDILSTVVRITPILVGVKRCTIFLWDSDKGVFFPAQEYGLSENQKEWFWNSRPDPDAPLMQEVLAGRPAVSVPDSTDNRWLLTGVTPVPGTLSILALPLSAKGKVLGAMLVDYVGAPEHFAERWMNILTGIANQTAIAIENTRLYRQEAEQERLERELEVAREIQASFLPKHCPSLPGWELDAYWQAARQVGGDFYDFFPLPDDRLGLVVADVADKGVPAALFMALSRTLVRVTTHDGRRPAKALQRANELIIADAHSDLFVTVFYAILDPQTGTLTYTSGGHNPPLLIRRNGQVESLRARGIVLGIVEYIELEEKCVTLEPGDVLVLYTDGVTDAINADEEEFGLTRLTEVIQRTRKQSPSDIIAAINSEVMAFVGNTPQFDDFTLAVLKRAE